MKKTKKAKKSKKVVSIKKKKASKAKPVKSIFSKFRETVSDFITAPKDIAQAIKDDHEGLRNFLDILKDTDREMSERRRAYDSFQALLKSHSVAEETWLYEPTLKLPGHQMHLKIEEGYVEHHVAEDLMARIEAATDPMIWSAHVNVLAENMEHHLKEEERDLLPLIRKAASEKENIEMLAGFLSLRGQTQTKVTEKNAGVLKEL